MSGDDEEREALLAELLAQLDTQLAAGTRADALDTSAVAADAELSAEWEADRQCVELLDRVRRQWSPDDDRSETPAPDAMMVETSGAADERMLGRFRILRELGHGGLGVVYLAYDPQLRRQVALKVPRAESLISDDLRRRFLREAEAAARLNHPHLITVYDSGEHDSICYIAAEFCPGPTLAEWLKARSEAVPIAMAAKIVQQLAAAVQHAHGRGVLHRDIKPSNVLLDRRKSGDGGREAPDRLEAGGGRLEARGNNCRAAHDSRSADGLGFCAEERAFSLQPPASSLQPVPKLTDFGMAKLLERDGEETRSGALVGTPAYMAPEQARGNVRELDARTDVYALGALLYEILVGRRVFESTSDVEALRMVLFEEPVGLRKLRPEIPRDLEAICLKCLAKSNTARYATAQQLADDLERFLTGRPTEARPLGALAQAWKWAQRRPAVAALLAVVALSALSLFGVVVAYSARLSLEVERAEREADTSRRLLYAADVRAAYETLKANNVVQALKVLERQIPEPGEEDLREFAWQYLRQKCDPPTLTLAGHENAVMAVAFSPTGEILASGGGDGTARIWNATTGEPLHVLRDDTTEVTCLAFAPDGRKLAVGNESRTIRLWDPDTGEKGNLLVGHEDQVLALAFSPDGKRLASGSLDATIRIWDPVSGQSVRTLSGEMDVVRGVAFSPDGRELYAVDEAEKLHIWRTADWKRLPSETSPREKFFTLAVSRTGTRIAAAGRREVISIWRRTKNGLRFVRELEDGHNVWIQALAYSPVDDTLASAGKEGVLQLWRPDESVPYRTLLGHKDRIWSVAWSPDGKQLASACADGTIKIWSLTGERLQTFPPTPKNISDIELLPDGARLATASEDGVVRLWDTATRTILREFSAGAVKFRELRLSPDGALLAARDANSTTKVWRVDTAGLVLERAAKPGAGAALDWDPTSRRLATTIDDGTVVLLDPQTNRIVERIPHNSKVRDIRFTPDGNYLITTSQSLQIWDIAGRMFVYEQEVPHTCLAIARNGMLVAAAAESNITLLDLASDRRPSTLVTIGSDVQALAISPDGKTLAAALYRPQAVGLWDLRTQQEMMRLECDAHRLCAVEFSRDNRRLVACGARADGTGAIWEWEIDTPTQTSASE